METKWIKWWKNKAFVTILCIMLSGVICSVISAILLPWPWNLIAVLVICVACGISSRIIGIKELERISEEINEE